MTKAGRENRVAEFKGRSLVRGETRTIGEWSRLTGIGDNTIRMRLGQMRWTPEQAVDTPTRAHRS